MTIAEKPVAVNSDCACVLESIVYLANQDPEDHCCGNIGRVTETASKTYGLNPIVVLECLLKLARLEIVHIADDGFVQFDISKMAELAVR